MKSTFNPCVRLFEEVSVSWSLPKVGIAEIEKEVRKEILTVSQTPLLLRETSKHISDSIVNVWDIEK